MDFMKNKEKVGLRDLYGNFKDKTPASIRGTMNVNKDVFEKVGKGFYKLK